MLDPQKWQHVPPCVEKCLENIERMRLSKWKGHQNYTENLDVWHTSKVINACKNVIKNKMNRSLGKGPLYQRGLLQAVLCGSLQMEYKNQGERCCIKASYENKPLSLFDTRKNSPKTKTYSCSISPERTVQRIKHTVVLTVDSMSATRCFLRSFT